VFFLGGFGLGMMYVPAVVAVGYWFEKRRSLVTGEQMRENSFFKSIRKYGILQFKETKK